MHYSLGVDLGARFAAVAIADDLGTHAAQLSPLFVVPSAVYLSPDGAMLTGDAALTAGESDPTRLARNFKKRLGDPTPFLVADAQSTPEQLMAEQLRQVVAEIAEQRGEPAQSIVLTYPVTWGPYRAEHFTRIAELSGINVRAIITEPVATATFLESQGNVKQGDIVAIVDFGYDSVTATLLRKGSQGFAILGTPEENDHAGSADFDNAMRTLLDQKLGGLISSLDPARAADAAMLAAIEAKCSAIKESLSVRKEASVVVTLPDGPHRLTITREEFARLIRPSVRQAVAALRRTISSAEIDEDAITSIALTGGASRIPLIAEEIAEVGRPVRSTHHPKLSVALGAAHEARTLADADARAGADAPSESNASGNETSVERSTGRMPWPPSRRTMIGIAAAVLVILGVIVATIVPRLVGSPSATTPSEAPADTRSEAPADTPSEAPADTEPPAPTESEPAFTVFKDGEAAAGLRWYTAAAGEDDSWGSAEYVNGKSEVPGIRIAESNGTMTAEWTSSDWLSQFWVEVHDNSMNLEEILDGDGALVFDLTVLSGSASSFEVAAQCTFPCSASVDLTSDVESMQPNETANVIVPSRCFTSRGLDATKMTAPFLLIGRGDISVAVDNIRWQSNTGTHPDAVIC
ncbi:Hsp70 family protein [Microbacterium sp.]|uniref:Hsp70 family protein n=1 Tax=Microbacterium sp. TaxID=51671 RepID=UPI0026108041|nr:Hsp70 family protein [Microbacterium sp.]